MDLAYLHLLINHFPIIGTLIGIVLMAVALLQKNILMQRSILILWTLLALLNPLAMKTGEEAEEKIEHLPGISEKLIHEHEEAAETANVLMICLGVISISAWLLRKKTMLSGRLTVVAFMFSIVVFLAMAKTGNEGGKIRHSETSAASVTTGNTEENEWEEQ